MTIHQWHRPRRSASWLRLRRAASALILVAAGTAAPGQPATAEDPGTTGALATNGNYTCLLYDHMPYCWGDNLYGELGDSTNDNRLTPVPVRRGALPPGATVVALGGGFGHMCALSDAGRAYCWGRNDDGQLGTGSTTSTNTPVAVDTSGVLAGVRLVRISGGYAHTCALSDAGRAYCWGSNREGALGRGDTTNTAVPVAVDASGVLAGVRLVQLALGDSSTCALSDAGRVYCWGYNHYGQLGDGTADTRTRPVAVDTRGALAGVRLVRITAGALHTCASASDGRAFCWGWNAHGQLGDKTRTDRHTPVQVHSLSGVRVVDIVGGAEHTCATSSVGQTYCWGGNRHGSVGDGSTQDRTTPVRITIDARYTVSAVSTAAGVAHTCVLTRTARVYCWGWNESGQLTDGTTVTRLVPTGAVGVPSAAVVTSLGVGGGASCEIAHGRAYCWGGDEDGELGAIEDGDEPSPVAVYTDGALHGATLATVVAGAWATCALTTTGRAYCWGDDNYGQLGDGTGDYYHPTPTPVDDRGVLHDVRLTDISIGSVHACAVSDQGRAYCWGSNREGELGDGSTMDHPTAVAVDTSGALHDVTLNRIAASSGRTCAVSTAGRAYCWGPSPTAVDTSGVLHGVTLTTIDMHYDSTCVLSTAGVVYCWGRNLGDGTTGDSSTPVQSVPPPVPQG